MLRLLLVTDNGRERRFVRLRQQELKVPLAGLFRIQQVVILDLPPREAVEGFGIGHRFCQSRQQQRHRREALLAVDDKEPAWIG